MLSSTHPDILAHLGTLEYGLQPVQMLPDGRYFMIIKMTKEAILTARLNRRIAVYLVPDPDAADQSLGFITAFFDDHDQPLTVTTPLFAGDDLLRDLTRLLSQETFALYFFDEHGRELLGVHARHPTAARFRETLHATRFPILEMYAVPSIQAAMSTWFGRRDPADDAFAYVIEMGNDLYPGVYPAAGLERVDPGPFQERDIAALLRRVFPEEAVLLNPIRQDSGTELTDVLVVAEEFILIVQAKDSPNSEATLRRPIARKRSVIRSHIDKAAKQLRGAIHHVQSREELLVRTVNGALKIPLGSRKVWGLVVVREMFDDDYEACSAPLLAVARECYSPCILLDYSSLHIMALHLPSPNRLMNGLHQIFDTALEGGQYPKPRFIGPPVSEPDIGPSS